MAGPLVQLVVGFKEGGTVRCRLLMVLVWLSLSCFLRAYTGSGVDNAIEITVVTSCGEYLTTNKYQNSDLFWALRGGGGGTYGVVTSITYRTYESLPVAYYYLQANATHAAAMKKLITGFFEFQPNLTDDGWGGYGTMDESSMLFVAVAPDMSTEAANISTQPLTDYASSLQSKGVSSVVQITPIPSWYEWYNLLFDAPGQNDENAMMTSRLLSRDTLAYRSEDVSEILVDCHGSFWWVHTYTVTLIVTILCSMTAGGKVTQIDPESAGINPAWRNAVVGAGCVVSWQEGASSQEIEDEISQLKTWMNALYAVAPNDGAYFNEVRTRHIVSRLSVC